MAPLHFLRLPAVKARTGMSRSSIYREMQAGKFPRPIRVGLNSVAWPSTLIEAWQQSRMQASAGR